MGLPSILSNKLGRQPELQNIHEWEYIRDTQVKPMMKKATDVLRTFEDTRDIAYVYTSAMHALFDHVTNAMLVNEMPYAAAVRGALQTAMDAVLSELEADGIDTATHRAHFTPEIAHGSDIVQPYLRTTLA